MVKILMWLTLIIPWFTLFFMRKESIRRYIPVAVFTALIVTITSELGYVKRWWVMQEKIVPWGSVTSVALAYGPFIVGTIWIFYFTYRSFWLYLGVNLAVDALLVFLLSPYLFEGSWYRLVEIQHWQVYLIVVGMSIVIYLYHTWQVQAFKPLPEYSPSRSLEFEIRSPLRRRAK